MGYRTPEKTAPAETKVVGFHPSSCLECEQKLLSGQNGGGLSTASTEAVWVLEVYCLKNDGA